MQPNVTVHTQPGCLATFVTKYSASDICTQTDNLQMKMKVSNSGSIPALVHDITKQLGCPHIHNETLYSSTAGRDVGQSIKSTVLLENSGRKKIINMCKQCSAFTKHLESKYLQPLLFSMNCSGCKKN